MDPAYPSSPSRSTSPPRQNKVITQRQYREKESESFSALREVIKDLTGEEFQTRQEILRKATELLSDVLQSRRETRTQVAPPVLQAEMFPATDFAGPSQASSVWSGQAWQSNAEFANLRGGYIAQPHDQQNHSMYTADVALPHATYGQNLHNYPGL